MGTFVIMIAKMQGIKLHSKVSEQKQLIAQQKILGLIVVYNIRCTSFDSCDGKA